MEPKDRKPDWLKVPYRKTGYTQEVKRLLEELGLNTVCEQANCPNMGECFSKRRATFMILGKTCTRKCTFCAVTKGQPQEVDEEEPEHIARAVQALEIRHLVITSVTRDDLPDGGAQHFAQVIQAVHALKKGIVVEVLIPDFQGSEEALQTVMDAKPRIINHNLETVPDLYDRVRPQAIYSRSLNLLRRVKEYDPGIYTKSGIMLGLGETMEQVVSLLEDLKKVGCDFITIGQYLKPSPQHHPVVEYVHPKVFEELGRIARKMGFSYVASAPLVRSSYNAEEALGIL